MGGSLGDLGMVVALVGALGVGKTVFVKGLAEGMEIDAAQVSSPTFVIANEYEGGRALAHVDLYRVESEGELENAGFVDLLEPGAVVAVEWADRFPGALPSDRLTIRFEREEEDPEGRQLEAEAEGPKAAAALQRFARALAASPAVRESRLRLLGTG